MAGPRKRDSDRAYEQLLEMILTLRLAPGEVVNEQSLAADLGLGRMPVHEAVTRLAADRLAIIMPRRGTVISPIALKDVVDMFEAREAIECGVAYIAATRANEQDLDHLLVLIEAADTAREEQQWDEYLKADHAFHQFLVHMINNPLLQDAADRLLLHNLRFWRLYFSGRPAVHDAMLSHQKLHSALSSHDPETAELAMREHISNSRGMIQSLF
ncbi:MAG: GntR family transcriptional regulator [Marmoricola sp.]|nr:GntR family transcriptional regulator [Marmoricola sp.]